MKRKQVTIAGNDYIRSRSDCALQNAIVVGVAAIVDADRWTHLGGSPPQNRTSLINSAFRPFELFS
jgi:hypothetical protein